MHTGAHLAQERLRSAGQKVARVRQKLVEESDVNRLAYERFYNTLTLVAGGTLALSLTYLGYLKTAGGHPSHLWVLKASWVSLLCCLVGSVFYHNFHTNYVSVARMREYTEKLRAERKASIEEVDNIRVIDETGKPWTSEDLKLSLSNEVALLEENVKRNKKTENAYRTLYAWAARVAQGTFVLGLVFLLAFAFLNT